MSPYQCVALRDWWCEASTTGSKYSNKQHISVNVSARQYDQGQSLICTVLQVLLEEADFAMNTIVAGEASWDGTALESRLRFDVIIDEPACANYVQTMLAQHYS